MGGREGGREGGEERRKRKWGSNILRLLTSVQVYTWVGYFTFSSVFKASVLFTCFNER